MGMEENRTNNMGFVSLKGKDGMLLQATFRADFEQSYEDTKKGFGWNLILIYQIPQTL
jgi:hypothetical protein